MSAKPNILWLVLDSLRPDHMSCYGYDRPTTPQIDRLAEQGVLFTQAIAPGHATPPVHTSWLTGLYASEHGIFGQPNRVISPDLKLLSEVLKRVGYVTAGFSGNIHLGRRYGLRRGFDVFVESQEVSTSHSSRLVHRIPSKIARKIGWGRTDWGTKYSAEQLTDTITSWMSPMSDANPFFILCNFMEPHVPHKPPWKFLTRFVNLEDGWQARMKRLNQVSTEAAEYIAGVSGVTTSDIRFLLDLYDAEIAFVDHCVGRLIRFLEHTERMSNTLVIITADHGDYYGEHGLIMHNAFLYDSLIHVPLILRLPDYFEGGIIYEKQVSTLGLTRTVLELAGLKVDDFGHVVRGVSLLGLSNIEPISPVVFSEGRSGDMVARIRAHNPQYDGPAGFAFKRSVRTSECKYIWDSQGEDEFFDLQKDPLESQNLINTDHPMIKQMKTKLKEIEDSLNVIPPVETNVYSREEEMVVEARLRELGYL